MVSHDGVTWDSELSLLLYLLVGGVIVNNVGCDSGESDSIDAFKKNQMHSGWWGLSRETISCYIYDIIIFPVRFSFVLSPFQ